MHLLLAALIVALLAAPAAAHEGHAALPDGFRAEVHTVLDDVGSPMELPGVTFSVAPDGVGLTVENDTAAELVVTGEQAGEPLVRLNATSASVNAASPQAKDVEGAVVDPDDAAELVDLVWGRAEPIWVTLPAGGMVSFIDHRAAPGHQPVREDFTSGDVAAEWRVGFTYDGQPYRLTGHIVAVGEDEGGAVLLWLALGVFVVLLAGGGLATVRRRARPAVDQRAAELEPVA